MITARSCTHDGGNIAYQVNKNYINKIKDAGGIPLIVTPMDSISIELLADKCDGLMVTGGDDLDPVLYNNEKHPKTVCDDFELDKMDLKLIKYFYKFNKPILGICRGIQSINVAFGGTLYQDLEDEYPAICEQTHRQSDKSKNVHHIIYTKEDTYAASLFGKSYGVNSFHHQAIRVLGKGLIASAISEDGIIEAIEANNLFAVQWHPEKIDDDEHQFQMFIDFIELCKDPH